MRPIKLQLFTAPSVTMRPPRHLLQSALVVTLTLLALAGCASSNHVYLTWQDDPRTTMTVNFQSFTEVDTLQLHFDTEPRNAELDQYRFSVAAQKGTELALNRARHTYHMEARDLEPGALYHFVLAKGDEVLTSEMRFRPLPPDDSPLRFIAGGDMSILPRAYQLTELAGEHDPMFGLIGGDLAYANGELGNAWMWDRWLDMWEDNMITSDGVMVPMILAIGNHEVNDETGPPEVQAPFYYAYFPQGGKSYFSRPLRDDTVLIVLDTGHTVPHDGIQAEWLSSTLAEHADKRNSIAVYHVPLYPSHRDFEDRRAEAGRKHWLPLFDQYNLRVGLEHHDHSFKRTKVLKNNAVADEGTVYLGDGSFGVNPRNIPQPDRWYLEKSSGTPHFWLVNIDDAGMRFKAISHANDVLDEVEFE